MSCPNCKRSPWQKRCCICCRDDKQTLLTTFTYAAIIPRANSANESNATPAGEGRYARMRRLRGGTAFSAPLPDETNGTAKPIRGAVSAFAHERCLNAVRNTPQQIVCADCGHLNRFVAGTTPFPNCTNCGRTISRTICRSCGQPMIKSPAYRFGFLTTIGRGEEIGGHFHPQCRSGIERRGEELIVRRKAKKVCALCGLPLGLIERLYRDRHRGCHELRYDSREPWRME